jgi:hypothetical protein
LYIVPSARIPPHSSPVLEDIPSIVPDESKQQRAQGVEDEDSRTAVKRAVFCAMWWDDMVDKFEAYPVQTRRQAKEVEEMEDVVESLTTPAEDDLPFPKGDHWTYPAGEGPGKGTFEEEWEKHSHLLVAAKPEMIREFSEGYHCDKDRSVGIERYMIQIQLCSSSRGEGTVE